MKKRYSSCGSDQDTIPTMGSENNTTCEDQVYYWQCRMGSYVKNEFHEMPFKVYNLPIIRNSFQRYIYIEFQNLF